MIWSVFPQDLIFGGNQDIKTRTVKFKDYLLLVDCSDLPQGQGRIIQILSTEPQHFLDNSLSPGKIINIESDKNL